MKLKTSNLLMTFFWSWFMGVTAISIGLGALFPSMNLISKPLVCPSGRMDLDKQVYRPYPGNTITSLTWYCVDEASGSKTELGLFPMSLYAGTFYGWLLFGIVLVIMVLQARSRQRSPQVEVSYTPSRLESTFKSSEDTLSRMKELKNLRSANLISETEYEEKRSEILKSI